MYLMWWSPDPNLILRLQGVLEDVRSVEAALTFRDAYAAPLRVSCSFCNLNSYIGN